MLLATKVGPEKKVYLFDLGNADIVLGHGIDRANFEEEKELPPDDLPVEEFADWYEQNDNWDYSYDTGKESIIQYFTNSYKATESIIKEHEVFFKNLKSINRVFVLGHSLADVDIEYFEKIRANISPNAKWIVSFFGAAEKDSHELKLASLGVHSDDIELVQMSQ
ncbi:AbiH family protein, partial [Roseimarinus sediminis]|uniref:AbiH family protein n=1 Tax=Roseimarinus sediminis TaxID=1610899 RepID=UPI003D2267C4